MVQGSASGGGRASGPNDNGSNYTVLACSLNVQIIPLSNMTHTISNFMTTKSPFLSNMKIGTLRSQNSRMLLMTHELARCAKVVPPM